MLLETFFVWLANTFNPLDSWHWMLEGVLSVAPFFRIIMVSLWLHQDSMSLSWLIGFSVIIGGAHNRIEGAKVTGFITAAEVWGFFGVFCLFVFLNLCYNLFAELDATPLRSDVCLIFTKEVITFKSLLVKQHFADGMQGFLKETSCFFVAAGWVSHLFHLFWQWNKPTEAAGITAQV